MQREFQIVAEVITLVLKKKKNLQIIAPAKTGKSSFWLN